MAALAWQFVQTYGPVVMIAAGALLLSLGG